MPANADCSRVKTRCLVGAVFVPGLHAVIARRHLRVRRHQPHRLLPRQPLLALDIPAMGEHRVIALDDIGGRLMRRVAGAERDPGQPRQIGPVGDVVGDEADRLIDQIRGQVIAVGVGAGRIDMGVVGHELRRVLVGLGVEEAVEAVEAAAERPAVERPGGAALGQRRDMPLADHVIAVGVRAQHLGERAGLARDLAAIAGIAGIEIGEAADADRMMVAAGEQRRARGRAHRRGVEAGIAQAFGREPIDGRRPDRRAVAAEIGEADIVEQHDEDVGRTRRRLCRVGGHQGFESATVLPMVPPNRLSSALIHSPGILMAVDPPFALTLLGWVGPLRNPCRTGCARLPEWTIWDWR